MQTSVIPTKQQINLEEWGEETWHCPQETRIKTRERKSKTMSPQSNHESQKTIE